MNVQRDDVAMLVHPRYPENKDRICDVIRRIPSLPGEEPGVWWLCEFRGPVRTDYGYRTSAAIRDWRLHRLAGPALMTESVVEPVEALVASIA